MLHIDIGRIGREDDLEFRCRMNWIWLLKFSIRIGENIKFVQITPVLTGTFSVL